MMADHLVRRIENDRVCVGGCVALRGAFEHAEIIVTVTKGDDMFYIQL